MSHMKTITIRELHQATGRWVRRASAGEVYVTERGRLVAKIVPASPPPVKPFFADPKFTPAFLANRKYLRGGTDSTQRSEEHTSELQSRLHLVCRLLLEKKKHTILRRPSEQSSTADLRA